MSARLMFNVLSPAGANARLTVLIFHRVLPKPDLLFPGEPDAARFQEQMEWLKAWFNVLPLSEAVERLRAGSLPARAAAITFDDGYADNLTVALPILRHAGLSATFFIAAGYLDGGRMWNDTVIDVIRNAEGPDLDLSKLNLGRYAINTIEDRRRSLGQLLGKLKYLEPTQRNDLAAALAGTANIHPPCDLMLTPAQVRSLAEAGMTIGAHTLSHPILSSVPEHEARAEMTGSKERLEAITGRRISLFAYPNGKPGIDYTGTHVRLAREVGFDAACSTGWGAAKNGCDIFQIPRFTPWDRPPWRYALRLARNMRQDVTIAH
jgi:peptidoglycan/xylan/chitin deacetylase (PgdA/CDA1 family)